MTRQLPVDEVHPTQLFLSKAKLVRVFDWFDFDSPNYESLPAFRYEGDWYLSDGHSRAFAAILAGAESVRLREEHAVREQYDFEIYEACIEWCDEAGVDTINDLSGRVVEPETFEKRWIDRCQNFVEHPDD